MLLSHFGTKSNFYFCFLFVLGRTKKMHFSAIFWSSYQKFEFFEFFWAQFFQCWKLETTKNHQETWYSDVCNWNSKKNWFWTSIFKKICTCWDFAGILLGCWDFAGILAGILLVFISQHPSTNGTPEPDMLSESH